MNFLKRNWFSISLICFSIMLIIIGLYMGEWNSVWHKATTICLSCIGIG